jgi:hypothetical protein
VDGGRGLLQRFYNAIMHHVAMSRGAVRRVFDKASFPCLSDSNTRRAAPLR